MDTITPGGWPTLPSRYYYAPELYEQEKEKIFYRSWFCVGRAEEVAKPRDFVVRAVGDESMIIARDDAGAEAKAARGLDQKHRKVATGAPAASDRLERRLGSLLIACLIAEL